MERRINEDNIEYNPEEVISNEDRQTNQLDFIKSLLPSDEFEDDNIIE